MKENIQPIENVDPEIADLFMDIANKRYKYGIRSIHSHGEDIVLVPAPIVSQKTIGRNDPCSCMSGKKYKRCCGTLS